MRHCWPGFHFNVCFTGPAAGLRNQQHTQLVMAAYWCDPATYREGDQVRACPLSRTPNGVELIYWKDMQQWEGRKYRAEELLLTANGFELKRFIVQLTQCGISPSEPIQAMTRQDTANARAFVFMPVQHRS